VKNFSLNALTLRWILLGIIILLLAAGSVGFYYAYKQMMVYNQDTLSKNAEADSTDKTIQQIESAVAYIEENEDAIKKSDSTVANSKKYQYQDQVIKDIRNIASDSHLIVNRIDFAVNDSAQTGVSAAPAGTAPSSDKIPGITTATATVSFSPQSGTRLYYQYILDFLYKIEQNNTKLHTSNIDLKAPQVSSKTIDLRQLTIDVYIKEGK
jgi:hypothetical protein